LISFTKGILVVLLGAIALGFLLADRQLALLGSPYFWIGILLGNVPVLAWYAAQWQHYGATFLQVHFQAQGLERLSQSVEGHGNPPWYYLLELLKYTWPWLLFWPGGLYLAWQKRHTRWGTLVLIGTVGLSGNDFYDENQASLVHHAFVPLFCTCCCRSISAALAKMQGLSSNSRRYPWAFWQLQV
jgi:4-amino-4-deoxy-L-arabinose transferase-like glycosyltransferase